MDKNSKVIALITILLTLVVIFSVTSYLSPRLDFIIQFSRDYPLIGPVVIILWRILAIVIPPLPGGIVSLALIPVFGWFPSFVYGTVGLLIGATISFFLARKFREPLVKKFVPLQQLHKWQGKLSDRTEFLTFLVIRLTTEPILDFISYIAGLSKISFIKFFIATFIILLPNALTYYLGETIYKSIYQENFYLAAVLILIIGFVYYRLLSKVR